MMLILGMKCSAPCRQMPELQRHCSREWIYFFVPGPYPQTTWDDPLRRPSVLQPKPCWWFLFGLFFFFFPSTDSYFFRPRSYKEAWFARLSSTKSNVKTHILKMWRWQIPFAVGIQRIPVIGILEQSYSVITGTALLGRKRWWAWCIGD